MKKSIKSSVIDHVLCSLLLFLVLSFGWFRLVNPNLDNDASNLTESVAGSVQIVEIQPSKVVLEPEPIETLKPFEVAEPLYGKDLYIFQLSQICEQYYPDVDPYIALAVMEIESNYNPNVESSAGAVGLMQVIPKYHARRAEKYGLNDIWDPYTNIIVGVDFLNELYQSYGSWSRALLGYNNSSQYVEYVLTKADSLRGGNIFGEKEAP